MDGLNQELKKPADYSVDGNNWTGFQWRVTVDAVSVTSEPTSHILNTLTNLTLNYEHMIH